MKKNNQEVLPESQSDVGSKDMITITRKIQLVLLEDDAKRRKEKYDLIRSWVYMVFRAANLIVNNQLFNNVAMYKVKEAENMEKTADARNIIKQIYDTSIENSTYRLISEQFPDMPSSIRSALNRKVVKKFNTDYKDVLKGQRSVSTYRYGMPIPFNLNDSMQVKVEEVDKKEAYTFTFLKDVKFILAFGRDRSNNRAIVDRIMSGEYKFCDSEIKVDGGKMFLMLTVRFKRDAQSLDYDKIAATNLGMNCPIFVTTNTGLKQRIGSKEEFLQVRLQMQRRYRKLQEDLVNAKGGHGRTRKMKALERLKLAETNFATTYNHKLSHHLIKFCVDNGIGTLKMEDLLGAGETMNKEFVLRNWSYHQLQGFAEYKAKMFRVNIVKGKNSYFTQMCNCCKNVSQEAVDLKERVYRCVNPQCAKHDSPIDLDENNSLNLLVSTDEDVKELKEKVKRKKAN